MSSNLPATMQAFGAFGALAPASQVLADSTVNPGAMAEGIGPSFGILTFRGKVLRIKYKGDEHNIMLPGENGMPPTAAPYVDVVIVHASPAISKQYYETGYQEGDTEAPDCFSTNGVSPDPASPKKQAELCASCKWNAFGSKANTTTGAKGKACQDTKRLAIVPANDMHNEAFGGPLLLRVPPASLQGMGTYTSQLQNAGHTFFSVKTRLQFDPEKAYPQILFYPIAALGDNEATIVKELQKDARVLRMLNEAVDQVRDGGVGAAAVATGGPAVQAAPAPTPAIVPTPAVPAPAVLVAPVAPTTAAPAPVPVVLWPPPQPVVAPAGNADGLDVPQFLKAPTPAAPSAPPAPVPPPAPMPPPAPTYTMTAGETHTREQYHAAGWTDDQLVAAGKLTITGLAPPPPAAAPTPARRGRRPAVPAPSPTPTAAVTATPIAASAPVPQPAPAVPAAPAQVPPSAPTPEPGAAPVPATQPQQDPALAALDAKLAAVL